MSTLDETCSEGVRWLTDLVENGGPDLRINAHRKALNEAHEFADEPCLEEAADVVLCVIGALDYQGFSLNDLALAIGRKVEINRARQWDQQADGTWQHRAR